MKILRYAISACFLLASASAADEPRLVETIKLPKVLIDQREEKIHTQGLYVTDRNWFVTGRLERSPKRPLFIRISRGRKNDHEYQVVDLSRFVAEAIDDSEHLDHPGGFDRDEKGTFWIPVSTSHRRGPTVILAVKMDEVASSPNVALSVVAKHRFEDHLGAICCAGRNELYAANWDTRKIYQINRSTGKTIGTLSWNSFEAFSAVSLAVQDWKYDRTAQRVVAGGIDKSPKRKPTDSNAIIAHLNLQTNEVDYVRLPSLNDVSRPVTNEGMHILGDALYLLPEDFGRGAKILRYAFGNSRK